jgi:hypothetical protein
MPHSGLSVNINQYRQTHNGVGGSPAGVMEAKQIWWKMVESRPGAGADAKRRPGSRPSSSNRTCPFRASGFPTGFTVDSRTRPQLHITKPEYPQLAEDRFRWKAAGAARGRLVASPQEMPYTLVDVVVDCPVCRRPGSVAVVCRPASEHPIEPIPHLRPRPDIARHQQVSHLSFDARLPDAGLRLTQGQSQPRDHPTRPIQCFCRFAAAQDREIIRVVDDLSLKLLPPLGVLPALQQTVCVLSRWRPAHSVSVDNRRRLVPNPPRISARSPTWPRFAPPGPESYSALPGSSPITAPFLLHKHTRSKGPLRLPDWPSPFLATFGVATSASPEPPPLTQTTFPACCAHYPGGPKQVLVGCKLARSRAGFLPHPHGLPRFPDSDARRLSSPTNNYLSGSFPHW